MSILDKKQMTEEDIKLNFITPAIKAKGWDGKITMETKITDGRINLKGNIASREAPYLGGSALFSALGSGASYILGSFLGTAMGNEHVSNFFGINPSTQENITEGIHGLTLDGIINFFKLIFGR